MTKTFRILLCLLLITTSIHAQVNNTADTLALKIPQASTSTVRGIAGYIQQHFTTDTARIRAIYVWITNNITYDIDKLNTHKTVTTTTSRQTVEDVLKTRLAVCEGYTNLFIELCKSMNIKAMFMGGFTKIDGVVAPFPHAWVAAELNGSWYLFDPTWGSGHVRNNQFVRYPTDRFYKVLPENMIKDHMPFDPMYQFLHYTVSNKEFIDGQTAINTTKPYFNYTDTLKQFALLSPEDKLKSEARRLEANGVQNEIIRERLQFLKKGTEPFAFNQANEALKRSISLFNVYINHKNKQLTTITDSDLLIMMDSIAYYANHSRSLLNKVSPANEANKQVVNNVSQHLEKFQARVVKEQAFVTQYLATDKASRRKLFSSK